MRGGKKGRQVNNPSPLEDWKEGPVVTCRKLNNIHQHLEWHKGRIEGLEKEKAVLVNCIVVVNGVAQNALVPVILGDVI